MEEKLCLGQEAIAYKRDSMENVYVPIGVETYHMETAKACPMVGGRFP